MNARPFWPPLLAGFVLGLALLLAFVVTGHGLAASGFFTRLAAAVGGLVAPEAAKANGYLGGLLAGNPLAGWISWEVVGLFVGALAGSLSSGRFRLMVERGEGLGSGRRLVWAFAGGALVGFASRLLRGCTSGLGLSGGATLAVGAFFFLALFFAGGFATMAWARRLWR